MDIQVPRIDGRTRIGDIPHPIIDRDSGKKIGLLECRQGMTTNNRRYHSRTISLFDDKLRGSFETHAECVAFAKGIEAAINQIIAPTVDHSVETEEDDGARHSLETKRIILYGLSLVLADVNDWLVENIPTPKEA